MHDVLIVSVPLIAILGGLFFNNRAIAEIRLELRSEMSTLRGEIKDVRGEIKDVRGEIKELRSEMNRRFDEIDIEQRYFHGTTANSRAASTRLRNATRSSGENAALHARTILCTQASKGRTTTPLKHVKCSATDIDTNSKGATIENRAEIRTRRGRRPRPRGRHSRRPDL